MSDGVFIDLYIPYKDASGGAVTAKMQALQILSNAKTLIAAGTKGVAITYSANYGQTRTIEEIYFQGGWKTGTNGANQAAVMYEMEELLAGPEAALQRKMRILPITTMNGGAIPKWSDDVHYGIATTDLDRTHSYLVAGWTVCGWQNQDSVKHPTHPYAIGGGIAKLPADVSELIQTTLIEYAKTYGATLPK